MCPTLEKKKKLCKKNPKSPEFLIQIFFHVNFPAANRSVSIAQVSERFAGTHGRHQEQRRGASFGEFDDEILKEARLEMHLYPNPQNDKYRTSEPVSIISKC